LVASAIRQAVKCCSALDEIRAVLSAPRKFTWNAVARDWIERPFQGLPTDRPESAEGDGKRKLTVSIY
jgi:hypothetical protein